MIDKKTKCEKQWKSITIRKHVHDN